MVTGVKDAFIHTLVIDKGAAGGAGLGDTQAPQAVQRGQPIRATGAAAWFAFGERQRPVAGTRQAGGNHGPANP